MTTLYSFTNGHCYNPLVLATDGNFYGAAGETVFRMTTNGVVSTVTEVPFQDPNGLLQGSDGNLYFTTTVWGPLPSEGGGVYQLTTSGVLTNAYSFLNTSNSPGGCNSQAALTQGPDGNFYGITSGPAPTVTVECRVFLHCHGAQLPIHQPIREPNLHHLVAHARTELPNAIHSPVRARLV